MKSEENDGLEDITDSPTGEYPPLVTDEAASGSGRTPQPRLNGANGANGANDADGAQATFWLTHLETEVSRLHNKWHQIDAEFKDRELRIGELRVEVARRDDDISRLTAELEASGAAFRDAEEQLLGKEAQIAALVTDQQVRDAKAEELATALAAADERHRALQQGLETAHAEVTRLQAAIGAEQAAAAEVGKRNEQLLLEQHTLRASIQDLETYIDGRRKSWSDMQTEIANYKDTLVGMGKALKTKDATLAEHDQEKQRLAVRILDLERQASELTGRRKEREAAYEELQKRLTDHLEAAEQLKAESAVRAKQNEQVLAKAVDNQKLVESLQRGIERRDESLAALETALETHKATAADLSNTRDTLAKRVDELERGLSDRSQQLQTLREDLQLSHEQQRLLETSLVERDEELERVRQSAEESSSLASRLTDDLRAAVGDADELRERLESSEQRITDLEEQHSVAVAETKRVTGELAAQQELVASLEEELRAKQATLGLLERNVHRITDLGASLAALDRSLTETETDVAAQLSSSASYSLLGPIEDVGSPTDPEARDEAKEDMLPIEIFMGSTGLETDVVDVGAPTENDARKLVAMIGDQGIDYPLRDGEMTIGRGHSSDIRIPSHFISRVHARIRTKGIATVIEDAGSKNGILVNSARVQRCILHDGDVVSLGGELNLKFIDAAH